MPHGCLGEQGPTRALHVCWAAAAWNGLWQGSLGLMVTLEWQLLDGICCMGLSCMLLGLAWLCLRL